MPVMLAPGATAHAQLRVTVSAEQAGCALGTAEELRIALPRQARPAFVPIHLSACSKKGPQFLSVQAIQPRAGIPGFPAR